MAKRPPKRILVCPNCGAEYLEGRLACPECGSDDLTGWKPDDEVEYQSVDIPDFYTEDRHSEGAIPKPVWYIAAVLVIAALIWYWVLGGIS